ncbi:hypothetical protein T492DRAFT_914978 [Pavlovales sp. CCMP2436]|nr:hypothetical protein T492DRAFT_914978 [Pavlovales sp. CCMP2436]
MRRGASVGVAPSVQRGRRRRRRPAPVADAMQGRYLLLSAKNLSFMKVLLTDRRNHALCLCASTQYAPARFASCDAASFDAAAPSWPADLLRLGEKPDIVTDLFTVKAGGGLPRPLQLRITKIMGAFTGCKTGIHEEMAARVAAKAVAVLRSTGGTGPAGAAVTGSTGQVFAKLLAQQWTHCSTNEGTATI